MRSISIRSSYSICKTDWVRFENTRLFLPNAFFNAKIPTAQDSYGEELKDYEAMITIVEKTQKKFDKISDRLSYNSQSNQISTYVEIDSQIFAQGVISGNALFDHLYLHIGFGFHVEIPLEEVEPIVRKRIEFLHRRLELLKTQRCVVEEDYEQVRYLTLIFLTLPYLPSHLRPKRCI